MGKRRDPYFSAPCWISEAEFSGPREHLCETYGLPGLRSTRLQQYRRLPPRRT